MFNKENELLIIQFVKMRSSNCIQLFSFLEK